MIRWESEEAWKNWETSEEHLAGHRAGVVNQNQIILLMWITQFIM